MKNKWIKYIATAVAALAVTASVQANQIQGSIGFTGDFTQNGTAGDLTTATSISIVTSSLAISDATGAFVGATMPTFASPIAVNPANNLVPNVQLWSVVVGGTTYKLLVTSETETQDTSDSLSLKGSGTIEDGNSADNTAGTWQINFGVSGSPPTASFTWQATSGNSVPDGGTTAMLLGGALMGLGLLKRKLMA